MTITHASKNKLFFLIFFFFRQPLDLRQPSRVSAKIQQLLNTLKVNKMTNYICNIDFKKMKQLNSDLNEDHLMNTLKIIKKNLQVSYLLL